MTPAEFLAIRQELHLTQAQLAARLDVHVLTVSRWERGTRKIPGPVILLVQTFSNPNLKG